MQHWQQALAGPHGPVTVTPIELIATTDVAADGQAEAKADETKADRAESAAS